MKSVIKTITSFIFTCEKSQKACSYNEEAFATKITSHTQHNGHVVREKITCGDGDTHARHHVDPQATPRVNKLRK